MSRVTDTCGTTKLTTNALRKAYMHYPEAVNIESNREIVKKNFISNGVSSLLRMSGPIMMTHSCFVALMLIDSYDPSSHVPLCRLDDRDAKVWLRNMDIMNGCFHSLVKYFAKKTPCSCLDEIYTRVRSTTSKTGHCMNCKQKQERSSLFICTGCEREQYCSKACQISHAPIHKERCREWQSGTFCMSVI